MHFNQTNLLTDKQKQELFKIWNQEAPSGIAYESIQGLENYLSTLANVVHTLVLDKKEKLIGWFADFDRDGDRWFAMLLDTKIHSKGIGSELLNRAKQRLPVLNGWMIDHDRDQTQAGKPYKSPVSFYLKNGFEVISDVRLELDHLSCVKMQWRKHR